MIINQYNDRLYDTRNFDQHHNYYAIRYDVEKYRILKDKNQSDSYTIYMEYFNAELLLSVDKNIESSQSIYNIIYGHFYNDQNFFLFKKVKDGKIIGYKIQKCNKAELYHNKMNQLYISNYFKDVQRTVLLLNKDANNDIADEIINPALSYIVYDPDTEKLTFMTLWDDNYNDETLEIIVHNPYIIQPK